MRRLNSTSDAGLVLSPVQLAVELCTLLSPCTPSMFLGARPCTCWEKQCCIASDRTWYCLRELLETCVSLQETANIGSNKSSLPYWSEYLFKEGPLHLPAAVTTEKIKDWNHSPGHSTSLSTEVGDPINLKLSVHNGSSMPIPQKFVRGRTGFLRCIRFLGKPQSHQVVTTEPFQRQRHFRKHINCGTGFFGPASENLKTKNINNDMLGCQNVGKAPLNRWNHLATGFLMD